MDYSVVAANNTNYNYQGGDNYEAEYQSSHNNTVQYLAYGTSSGYSSSQDWILVYNDTQYFYIVNKDTKRYLTENYPNLLQLSTKPDDNFLSLWAFQSCLIKNKGDNGVLSYLKYNYYVYDLALLGTSAASQFWIIVPKV